MLGKLQPRVTRPNTRAFGLQFGRFRELGIIFGHSHTLSVMGHPHSQKVYVTSSLTTTPRGYIITDGQTSLGVHYRHLPSSARAFSVVIFADLFINSLRWPCFQCFRERELAHHSPSHATVARVDVVRRNHIELVDHLMTHRNKH